MKKVMLFLCQGLEEYEASVFTDVVGWTRSIGVEAIELVTVALRPKVTCAWNFIIEPEYVLADAKNNKLDTSQFDALAIPGGMSRKGFYQDAYDERLLTLIREFDASAKLIVSVCVGALPIAKIGILTGRNGTTYHLSEKRQTQMTQMGVNVIQQPIVIDDNVITSRSPSTALDVAFLLVEKLTSSSNVHRVKKGMGFIE